MNDSVPPLASRPASPAAPAFQDSSMGWPTLREVLATPRPTSARSPFILHWGPVPLNDAQAAGATFPTSSVVLIPHLPTSIVVEAVREIPSDVLPRCDDTVSSLVSRLSQSSFLEDSRVLQGGRGPRRVRLNDTDYAQPRRRSWSVKVEVEGEGEDEVGSTTTSLLNYTAFGRLPEDLEAVPMPRPVFNLNVALWTVAFDFLTDLSKRHPPTGCQLLLYYQLFGSRMARHRDNYNTEQMKRVLQGERSMESLDGSSHSDTNSQMVGSNVLIYTEGDADMTFALSFFPAGQANNTKRKNYVIHPTFCTKLGSGTLLVFSPVDDLLFCHEAWFGDPASGTHRIAFVFRWLTQARAYDPVSSKQVLSPHLQEKQMQRERDKKKKKASERRALFRR